MRTDSWICFGAVVLTALWSVCASGADTDGRFADAGARFEFLFSWGRVTDEASAREFSEIGVTDIIASGPKGFRAEEQKRHDYINGADLRGRLPKEEFRRVLDERRKEVESRFGGEPSAPLDLCATLIGCFLSDTNCVLAKAKIDRTLAANPDAEGIAFDYIGYTNFRSCECDDCRARLAAYLKKLGLEENENSRNGFFRISLVSYINTLVDYVHGIRPGMKVTIHLYPVFLPDPIYGKDLRADTVQETVAWYFQWPDAKIADYTRRIHAGERQPGSVSVPFVGLNAATGQALAHKTPARLEEELRIILAAGGRRLGVCNGGDMVKPGYREVFAKYCRPLAR